jgi:protein-tyrosine phosphatase
MIDLHAHILPGVDDGPATWAEAIKLCRQLDSQGVDGVVATPHFLPGRYPEAALVLSLVQELNERLSSISCAITVYPGAEAYLVPELPRLVSEGTVPTLNNAGRYLLVELPLEEVPLYAENVLYSLLLEGVTPVLAHPERNARLREAPTLIATLVERGALVQVNAGSLAGGFGLRVQKLANNLLQQGLVHFVGSDAHCPHKRPPIWPAILPRLEKLAGREATLAITTKNPTALLSGDKVVISAPVPVPGQGSNYWKRTLARLFRS